MITELHTGIFDNIPDYSVLMHQVNCIWTANSETTEQFKKRFPAWYADYIVYCNLFRTCPEKLLGKIHSYRVNDRIFICSAFTQMGVSKTSRTTDYGAWHEALNRVERDMAAKNNQLGECVWSLHVSYGIGCGLGGGDWNVMTEMFEYYFKYSNVKLVIHKP